MRIRYALVACAAVLALAACGNDKAPANGGASTERQDRAAYVPGQTYDAEDYAGPVQAVTGHDHEAAVVSTTAAKKECVRYKTTNGKRRCAEYRTTPAKTTTTDDEDWFLVLADGTRVDVEQGDQARYPVGATYP